MLVPDQEFSIKKAVDILGENCRIDIIDSERQLVFPSTLGYLRKYFASPKREKVYNVISLEFTGTKLESYVTPPFVVRELSWLPSMWPTNGNNGLDSDPENVIDCPRTERFLLLSAAGSYTDFHIDFGGSSVWYHIVKGSKVFYLAPPTQENLEIYEKWNNSSNRVETFLGDSLTECLKLSLSRGQTLLLPGGWIHAVVTPTDSIVFGGNFLHSLDITLQLKIFEIERRIDTNSKFLFPGFYSVQFCAGRNLSEELSDICEDVDALDGESDADSIRRQVCQRYLNSLVDGCGTLLNVLRMWLEDDNVSLHNFFFLIGRK